MSGYRLHRLTGKETDLAQPQRGHLMQPAAADLTVHHAYFELTVGILPNRIKGWNLFPDEDKITLFPPI